MAKNHPWVDEIVAVFDEIGRPLSLSTILYYIEKRAVIQERSNRDSPYASPEASIRAALEQRSEDSENWRKTNNLFYNVNGRGSRSGKWGLREKASLSSSDARLLEEIRKRNREWRNRAHTLI